MVQSTIFKLPQIFFLKMTKRISLSLLMSFGLYLMAIAQAPNNYYTSAEGESNENLREALHEIIDGHTVVSYKGLYDVYETSDLIGTNQVWDMYSTCSWTHGSKKCGNYSTVCDCYNREHSVPQSWFNERSPMVSDAFHVYPTDGKVNGQRSNFPFGECNNGTSLGGKALGRLGSSTFSGYNGTVFEPDDEYKGDFARTYFYMTTRYLGTNLAQTSNAQAVFNSNADLSNYAIQLFLKWHREDPVSQKEIDRNNAVYSHQHNRNPFIDHPELAEYIWGSKKGNAWYTNSTDIGNTQAPQLTVTPNPAKDFIIVEGIASEFQYSIFNMTGTLLEQGNSDHGNTIYFSNLPQGLYIIQIIADGQKLMSKFVVTQ